MGKKNQSGKGFSSTPKNQIPKKLRPKNPADYQTKEQQALTLINQGKLDDAELVYKELIEAGSGSHIAYGNLGALLKIKGDLQNAILCFRNALRLKPNYTEVYNNLGVALKEKGDLDAAIDSYNAALQLKPDYPDAHYNLGNALQEQGDLTAAIDSYNAALQLKPNYPDAQKNLSMTQLLLGDYERGWERYEYRFQCKKNPVTANASPSCNQWNGENLSQGKKLLLVSEQGLGDTLQFMRYADPLRDKGLAVSLCAPPKLHSLIQASGIDLSPLTPEQANQVADGEWIPLLSVPRYLGVTPANPITTEPYIKTTDELTTKWAAILGTKRNPVVGINWQGNPKAEKDGLMGRSLSLEMFAPITSSPHISFLSLQKGFGSEQLETCSFKDRFVSCQDQVNETWNFLETAAIIANCDLVITSDTSVAHLSGGMGKTTWLLLQKAPDWRWGLEGHTTFWYPSMRLFRQKERGNWNDVMERVAEELQKHF